MMINGPGGVGKSALALRWLDAVLNQFPDGALYAVLTETTGRPVAAEDVLGAFLRALGVPADIVPTTLSERVGLFRSVTAGRSIAVLLDDAFSAGQVRVLLPSSGSSVVVVTSRSPLVGLLAEGASVVTIGRLDSAAAIELVEHHVGAARLAAERAAGEQLVDRCEGLPIALAVASALIASRPRRSVADFVAALDNERRRLDMLSLDEDLSVRATFDLSYRILPSSAVGAYHVVGINPGVLLSGELVAAVCGSARASEAIDALLDAGVLDEIGPGRYRCHQLVRTHARAVVGQEVSSEDRNSMEQTVSEWHLFVAQAASAIVMPARPALTHEFGRSYDLPVEVVDHDGALAWLERHRLDLAAVMRSAVTQGRYEIAYKLAYAIQPLLILHKHNSEAVEVNRLGLTAAVHMRDWHAETEMRKRLARVYVRLDEFTSAQQHIDELLAGARQRSDRRGLASGLKTLGGLHSRLGEHEQAVLAFDEAAQIIRALDLHRDLALALIDLGRALLALRDVPALIGHLDEAMAILRSLEQPDPYNTARASHVLAQAHLLRGETEAARQLLEEALAMLVSVDADHERATTHDLLAQVHDRLGDAEQARSHRDRAAQLMRPSS
ncbi:tetratricopeptide repeat protein [Actinophytocola oryzae]|uniref:Putative ATPase n=1 Tax=Actinophytocola oryzae TaxID=502181 RepID=A0A4R7W4A3_9PSEU|nr:tetratricopeptide repeat protein [Actinophytocola oryzae]TDV56457.1 putative ATPase [Actinophytocola oryzae]